MRAAKHLVPDWRDAAAYAPVLAADRSILAWEWLRRDPDYVAAADRADHRQWAPEAERWGLVAFEAPDLSAPRARPVWSAAAHSGVLGVLASGPGEACDCFELERFEALSTIVPVRAGREHLLISDGLRIIRLDVLAGTLTEGATQLSFLLGGLASAERPLLTLRRLLALARSGGFSPSLHPRVPRARRWVLMLRANDALEAGADQRQIAEVLLSTGARETRWRSRVPSLRSQVQRLVRSARAMAAGSWRDLLR